MNTATAYLCYAVAVAFALSGCDEAISREHVSSYVDVRPVRCTRAGYCMDCGMSFNGKYDCMPRFKPYCSGRQSARVNVNVELIKYESGKTKQVESVSIIEKLSDCK